MKILLATKDSEVERLGFVVREYSKHILPMVGIGKNFRDTLSEIDYDIGIGFLYPYKIPMSELRRKIWINFHPGILPQYGGRNVAYHAMMNAEERFGGTVHYMSENFDEGAIIARRFVFVHDEHNAGDINKLAIDCLYYELEGLLPHIVENAITTRFSGHAQNYTKYYPKESLNEYIELDKRTKQRIRALTTEQHSAKIYINGARYKIIRDVE